MSESEDKKIREKIYKKDLDFSDKIKKEMEEQQNMLKSYFKQYKQPTNEDPSVMRRQTSNQRALALKSVLSPFRVFGLFYDEYWNKQCATAEQRYVLRLCKQHTKKQIAKGMLFSVFFTSLISYRMRMVIGLKFHILSFVVGLSSGFLYGVLSSSQYTLEKFESLGQNYALGRSSITEINKYRMDKSV